MLQKGAPLSITIEKGVKPTPLDILNERGGSIWLIFPLTEGLDASAVYSFEGGSFRFTAKWPKGTPEPIRQKLSASLQKALKDPKVIERFATLGTAPVSADMATPAALDKRFQSEIARWSKLLANPGQK